MLLSDDGSGLYKNLVTAAHQGFPQLRMATISDNTSEPIGSVSDRRKIGRRHLTTFGKSIVLTVGEVSLNIICWVVCGILFHDRGSALGLALLSWVSFLSMSF